MNFKGWVIKGETRRGKSNGARIILTADRARLRDHVRQVWHGDTPCERETRNSEVRTNEGR